MVTEFRPAQRSGRKLLIGIAGPSGSGKTYSALELATGLASSPDKIGFIDTENGRAEDYAAPPGKEPGPGEFGFHRADLSAPFTPMAYDEAILTAAEAGYEVVIVDSMSHEHAGDGGLLDWHDEEQKTRAARMPGSDPEWRKMERANMGAWIKPKQAHKRMVTHLLQIPSHIILCFRAEQKVDIVRGKDGKTEIVPKKLLSGFSDWIPIAEKNILYELTTSVLVTPDKPGCPQPIKVQEQHRAFFPPDKPMSREAGRRFAEWAAGGGPPAKPATIPIREDQETALASMLEECPEGTEAQLLAKVKVGSLAEIPAEMYERCVDYLERKRGS